MSQLGEIVMLRQLTRLSISDNPLEEIPEDIDQKLPNLTQLDIHDCKGLKPLPKGKTNNFRT